MVFEGFRRLGENPRDSNPLAARGRHKGVPKGCPFGHPFWAPLPGCPLSVGSSGRHPKNPEKHEKTCKNGSHFGTHFYQPDWQNPIAPASSCTGCLKKWSKKVVNFDHFFDHFFAPFLAIRPKERENSEKQCQKRVPKGVILDPKWTPKGVHFGGSKSAFSPTKHREKNVRFGKGC